MSSALISRINRALAHEGLALRKPRSERDRQELGEYYVHDLNTNCVSQKDVDPQALAQQLGVRL